MSWDLQLPMFHRCLKINVSKCTHYMSPNLFLYFKSWWMTPFKHD